MRYSVLLDTLQNLINFRPSQKQIGDILGLAQTAISGRANRDSEFKTEEIEKIEKHYAIKILGNSNADCVEVDYYPEVFGSCGSGVFVLSEKKESISVPKSNFFDYRASAQYSVINAVGNSMAPYILDNDKLVVEHIAGEQIKDNKVYVFAYNNEIFVKRLIKNVDEIVIISDNDSPIYRPRYIEKEDINNLQVIGQVVGLMRNLK